MDTDEMLRLRSFAKGFRYPAEAAKGGSDWQDRGITWRKKEPHLEFVLKIVKKKAC